MNLTKKYLLNLSKKDQDHLLSAMKEGARLWNDLVYICRNEYKQGRWITAVELQKQVQSQYNLHSDIITSLCQRIDSNRKTARIMIKQNPKFKYPYKKKEEVTISGKNRQILNNNYLSLNKNIKIKIDDSIDLSKCTMFHIVHKKSTFYLYMPEEQPEAEIKSTGVQCAIDMGEIHAIATICTNSDKLILTGRVARSFKRFRNKSHAKLNKDMKKCQRDSRRHKRLIKAKDKLSKKSKNKLRNFYHHLTNKFVETCIDNNVDTVYLGNLKNIGQNTKRRLRHESRQKMSQFEVGTIRDLVSYKCEMLGIKVEVVSEKWTTQTCPACGKRYKPKGRVYKCSKCGFVGHRDIVGCYNILSNDVEIDLSLIDGKIRGRHPIKISTQKRSRRFRLNPCISDNISSLSNQESPQFIAGE